MKVEQGTSPEQLSRSEVTKRTKNVLTDFAVLSHSRIRPLLRAGLGKEVVAYVRNRPGEAQHIVDAMGEPLLSDIIRTHELPSRLIGENNTIVPLPGPEILVDFAIDPLDNTSPYVRGLDTLPYAVVGAYDHAKGTPIGATATDLIGNRIYRAADGKATLRDLEMPEGQDVKPLAISTRTDLSDPNITIASFVSEREYFSPFADHFRYMVDGFDRKGYLYPGGGAFIYALMASGAVDAYVMMDEPRSEIDPGLPLLTIAGGKAVSVDRETGKKTPYKFDAELTASGTIPLFIAYAQETIADQIIESYLKGKQLYEEQTEALKVYRQLGLKPGEEYHFPAQF